MHRSRNILIPLAIGWLLSCASLLHATKTPVTVNLRTILGTPITASSGAFVRIELKNYGGTPPTSSDPACAAVLLGPVDIYPSNTGVVSTSLCSNNLITPANTYYSVQYWFGGSMKSQGNYLISGTTTIDLGIGGSTMTPPGITNLATLDQRFIRLDLTNAPYITGTFAPGTVSITNDCSLYAGADIGAKINACIAAIPSQIGIALVPAGIYDFSTTIFKPRGVILEGAGPKATVLHWTLTSGVALAVGSIQGTDPYFYQGSGVYNLALVGPNSGTAIGLWVGGDPTDVVLPSAAFAHMETFQSFVVSYFNKGVVWGNNTFATRWRDVGIHTNGIGIELTTGISNSDENNSFSQCVIHNNSGGAVRGSGGAELQFSQCSFDYNNDGAATGGPTAVATFDSNANILLKDCHLEQFNGPFIDNSATQATIQIIGGQMYLMSGAAITTPSMILQGGPNSKVHIDSVNLFSGHAVTQFINWTSTSDASLYIGPLTGNGNSLIGKLTNTLVPFAGKVLLANFPAASSNIGPAVFGNQVQVEGGLQVKTVGTSNNLDIYDITPAAPTPHKFIRTYSGRFQVMNSANGAVMLEVTDTGTLTIPGGFYGSNWYISETVPSTLNGGVATDADADNWINFHGYADGVTRFRDLNIGDGKGAAIATFTGSTKVLGLATPLASSSGGTGNGFTKFSGPASAEKTFTLPNASVSLMAIPDNCASSASPAVCGAKASGSFVIAAAATTVTVNTSAVGANSVILISEDSSLGTKLSVTCNATIARTYSITARVAATSFAVDSSAAPITNPACLSYWIVN